MRETAVQNLVSPWTPQWPEAPANGLNELPEGSPHDAGLSAYTQALAQTSQTQFDEQNPHPGGQVRE